VVQEAEVLTVLFTDLVGSTNLLSSLGDDAADELRRSHFSVLRRAIDDHRGREVKSLGDGLMVAFPSARQAVACAAAMQEAVSAEGDGLGLRVGIDAGEPIPEDQDLFGTPVVVARRLCDVAEGGQVLVSDVVRMLCGRRLGLPLEALGPLELKGLDEPVLAHAVRWKVSAPRVRLCGGLAVEHDGERLDERLPSRQARALFALLVLERGHPLSREAIADALWPDVAPRSRDASIRALLTAVRRVFGSDSVDGRESVRLIMPAGTVIDVEEAERALGEAETALERGDHDGAAEAARRATALTADELLPGMRAAWIDDRRADVEQLALRALEIDAEASLRAGRAPDAERAARALVERAPYRESAHGLLMEALAARGNLAEATLVYDRLRTLLRDDLGTTPAPAIVALHDRLLTGERDGRAKPAPRSAPTALSPVLARATARPFVARGTELERLRTAWEAARRGEGRLVALAGEPGIGKTSLAAAFAREAQADGATVLLGRCHPEALVPYEPFVEALRQLPPEVLRDRARVLMDPGAAPAPLTDDPSRRHLLFDAVADTLADASAGRPIVLMLEDLHWADQPTLLLMRHVARAGDGVPLLVVATYRTTEVAGTEAVAQALTDLGREVDLDRIALRGLDDAEVADLIRALDGRRSSTGLGAAMCADTAGNPLFVGQLLRHLGEMGALVERGGELTLERPDGRLGVPETVSELVARRLAVLPPETAPVLNAAAMIGRTFADELVEAVGDGEALEDALDGAVAAGLVEDAGPGRHAFVHALVRDAIYERIGSTRRARLHLRIAEALAAARDADPAELAHHYLAGGDRDNGVAASVAAAERALGQLAYEDAAAHYERALEALGGDRTCALLLALGDAHARAGERRASKAAYREAAELAEGPDDLARAALGYGGRITWEVGRDDPELLPLLERALEAQPVSDDPLRIRLLARLGGGPLRDAPHPPERRWALTEEALEAARRLGDPATTAYALAGHLVARHSPANGAERVGLAGELLQIARNAGDMERVVEAYDHRSIARAELGDIEGAKTDVAEMARLAQDLHQPSQAWFAAELDTLYTLLEGRLGEVERLIAEAMALGERAQAWNAVASERLHTFQLRWMQGRVAEVVTSLRDSVGDFPTYPVFRCALAVAAVELGHEAEARGIFGALAADDFAAIPFDEVWLVNAALLALAAAALGERDAAAALHARMEGYADLVAVSSTELALGSAARYIGLLEAAMGRWDDAIRHYEVAIATNARIGAWPWRAAAQCDCAAALLERDGPGDHDRAGDLLAQAAEAFTELEMTAWAARATARRPLPAVLARAAARPFVARTAELDRLRRAWAAARAGAARIVLLGGEPGIGKTTLAARAAREAHRRGAMVVLGRCHQEALVPYEPFVELLRQLPDETLRKDAAALTRVMPELALAGRAPPADPDDQTARYLMFDAVARAIGAAARDVPLVLVIEDLHWADPPTLLLLRHVARAVERARVLAVLTYRTTEVPGTEQVVRALADLERELSLERVPLAGLADAEVVEMIGAIEGRPPSIPLGSAMRRDTAGNPLFVAQLLRHLEDEGVLVERDGELSLAARDGSFGVPDSAKELVRARLSALDPEVVATLRTAAVIGRAFGHELVAKADERPAAAVLDALEEGMAAGLLEEAGAGRHVFVHALVREAIYEQAGAARRAALHERVADALEASRAGDPAELAHHYLAAGNRAKGLEHSVTSAERALSQLAYEDAAAHYANALEALGDADPPRRCELLLALGDARGREGSTPASKATYREAARLATELEAPEQLARAAVGYGGRLLWDVSRDDRDLVPLLERALDRIGSDDSTLRVRLLARLGGGPLRDDGDPARRRAITQEALDAARRLGDAPTLAWALDGYISARHSPDATPEPIELATELIEVCLQAGDVERAVEAYEHRAAARLELGDIAGSNADIDAMAELAADLRQPAQDWFVAERRAVTALHEGRLEDAEALVADARRIGSGAIEWNAAVTHALQLVVLRRLQGRLEEVEPVARAAREEIAPSYPICGCAHLHVLAALGRADEAHAGLESLAPDGFAALNFDETWLGAVALLAEATHDLGAAEHAATLYEQLAPYADRVAVCTPEIALGGVSRYLGLLAAARGHTTEAVAQLKQAVAFNERIGARPYAELARRELAALQAHA
jgi:predicted ATPase/class 3 adenylate cyclase/DNA-binding SARP family transcriptional activator